MRLTHRRSFDVGCGAEQQSVAFKEVSAIGLYDGMETGFGFFASACASSLVAVSAFSAVGALTTAEIALCGKALVSST